MSINLETAEKLVLCVITQGVGFLMWYWSMKKKWSPTKNPLSDDQPEEDWRRGTITGHIPCPFSLRQTSTCDPLQWLKFQSCLLHSLNHYLSLPIDNLSTYKFWSLLGLLLKFSFLHLMPAVIQREKKLHHIHPSKSLTLTLLVLIHYLGPLMCTTSSEEQCFDDVVQPMHMYIIRVISFWSACGFNKHSRWLAMPEARMDNHTALPSKQ